MEKGLIEGLFYDGERSRGHRAHVELAASRTVQLTLEDELGGEGLPRRFELPLAEVEISDRLGSIPRRLVLPGIGFFETTDNEAVDRALAALGHSPGLVHWLEQRWPVAIASLIAVALGSALFIRFGLPAIADFAARTLPPSVDSVLGAQTLEILDEVVFEPSTLPEARQGELRLRFDAMTQPLEGGHAYRLENRSAPALGPNALALPSGIVVMTDELVLLAQHDDELVAVLAHELGHVRGRHALRQLLQSTGVSAIAFALLGDVSSASALFGAVPALIQAKHSRDFEREADGFAKGWLLRNGIAPERFDAILCRMRSDTDEVGKDEQRRLVRYLSTHPTTGERARCDVARSPTDQYFDEAEERHEVEVRAEVLRELNEDVVLDVRKKIRRAREEIEADSSSDRP